MPKLIEFFKPTPYKADGLRWFFDLDNTLHDASFAIFKIIDSSMTQAVMHALQVNQTEANRLRQKYWQKYGATMIGLHKHHGIKPEEFLRSSHDFDVSGNVKPESNLSAVLNALPGQKYVLTNAPFEYALKVLDTLSIKQCFQGICAIDHMILRGRHKPKPSLSLLQSLQVRLQLKPAQCILVEDTLENLKSAKQLGWKTIYVHHLGTPFTSKGIIRPPYVDLRVKHIKELLRYSF